MSASVVPPCRRRRSGPLRTPVAWRLNVRGADEPMQSETWIVAGGSIRTPVYSPRPSPSGIRVRNQGVCFCRSPLPSTAERAAHAGGVAVKRAGRRRADAERNVDRRGREHQDARLFPSAIAVRNQGVCFCCCCILRLPHQVLFQVTIHSALDKLVLLDGHTNLAIGLRIGRKFRHALIGDAHMGRSRREKFGP